MNTRYISLLVNVLKKKIKTLENLLINRKEELFLSLLVIYQ